MKSMYVRIFGDVQGVGFRYHAREIARDLHIAGSVRNMPDGTVECNVYGPDEAVDSFISWCNQGPSGANVKRIQVTECADEFGDSTFTIEP